MATSQETARALYTKLAKLCILAPLVLFACSPAPQGPPAIPQETIDAAKAELKEILKGEMGVEQLPAEISDAIDNWDVVSDTAPGVSYVAMQSPQTDQCTVNKPNLDVACKPEYGEEAVVKTLAVFLLHEFYHRLGSANGTGLPPVVDPVPGEISCAHLGLYYYHADVACEIIGALDVGTVAGKNLKNGLCGAVRSADGEFRRNAGKRAFCKATGWPDASPSAGPPSWGFPSSVGLFGSICAACNAGE